MTQIFDVKKSTVSEHLVNIFASGELEEDSVVRKIRTTASDGKNYWTSHYNLDAILSVGYRVNSPKAIQFRRWASAILKEYLIKGFSMDDERLKQGKQLFGKDYFDELLERIRDIRASERRFYQKVTDIYIQCSYDYDQSSNVTHDFFAHAQNKLEYAVTSMTAAEIIKSRADHKLPNMGLTTWKQQKGGGKIVKNDIGVAKNYLAEGEIEDLNRLVSMFLDYAENLAQKGKRMSMKDWHVKLDDFLKFNEYQILNNYGSVKKKTAEAFAAIEYDKFKPIQEAVYMSDFDKAVETIKNTGELPKAEKMKLKTNIPGFDKKLKQALNFNPKDLN
ncbi:MAG: virulence RhuM family protein [Rhizobiales bacterium]|nr:virulence RhuM family protein [Hyphomicrobiales bacterium]